MTKVKEGVQVALEYTLYDDEGAKIESNVGDSPLEYIHGAGQIVVGLERELEGLQVGDTKKIAVEPKEGYGELNPEAFIEVPLDKVPEEARQVGAQIQTSDPQGQVLYAWVSELKDETVLLNFNHPFAGQTLHFEVKVLEIKELD